MYTCHAKEIGRSLVDRLERMARVYEVISLAEDTAYGLTWSIDATSPTSAMHAVEDLSFGETHVDRKTFEVMQGFHAGVRRSGIGGADGEHGGTKIQPRTMPTCRRDASG